jgi:hypothetical protein
VRLKKKKALRGCSANIHIMYWHKTGALADFEAEDDDDPLGEGLMDEGTGEGTLIGNIRLFFSEEPFFV